jgi:hypothetical protein
MIYKHHSTIKVPAQNWTKVKKDLLSAYNLYTAVNYVNAKAVYRHLENNRPKGTRNYNYHNKFQEFFSDIYDDVPGLNKKLIWDSLWSVKNPDRKRPIYPKKSFFQLANNQTKVLKMHFTSDFRTPDENFFTVLIEVSNKEKTIELELYFDSYLMINHCCYPQHPVMAALVNRLNDIKWQKNTGGTLYFPMVQQDAIERAMRIDANFDIVEKHYNNSPDSTEFKVLNTQDYTTVEEVTEEEKEEPIANPAFISLV